jgi:hypothetical protein
VSWAQVATSYTFTQTAGTYSAISGGTVFQTGTFDDVVSSAVTIPSFTFNGTAYTSIRISTNGFITFGATAPTTGTYIPLSTTTAYAGAIAPFGRDLQGNATAEIRYEQVGSNFVIQYKDVRRYGVTGENLNFQVILTPSNNSISVVYGTMTPGSNTFYPQVGLRGATASDYNNRTIAQAGGNWINSTAGSSNTSTMYFNSAASTTVPSSGLTYSWQIASCLAPSGLAASAITANSATLNWTAPSAAPANGYEWELRTSGNPGTAGAVASGTVSATTVNLTSLTPNTAYSAYVRSACAGSNSAWTPAANFSTLCNAQTVPFFEGFETGYTQGSAIAGCWTQAAVSGTGSWLANSTNTTYNRTPRTGSFNATLIYGNTRWMFIPVQLTGGVAYQLQFYARQDGSTATNATIMASYGTTATAAGMTSAIVAETGLVAGDYQEFSGIFTPSTSGTYVIGIRGFINSSPWYISLDDISLVLAPSPCTGTPAPGNTVSSVSSVCTDVQFTLSLQNSIVGTGVTYQWYRSTVSSSGPWTTFGGSTPTVTTTQSQQSWYYCAVTCSGNTGSSTPVQVNPAPAVNCYCTPIYSSGKVDGDLISNVVIPGTTLSNNTGTEPVNPAYTYFTGQPNFTATLQAGTTYQIQITVGSFGSQNIAVWIDFNEDGVFSTNERVGFSPSSVGSFGTVTFPLSLPCNPVPGVKRMRVRDVWNTEGNAINPCTSYGYGEAEDYDVTIVPPPPCPVPSGLLAGNVTFNSAALSWTIGCVETMWEVEYGPAGFTPGTGTPVSVASTNYTLQGLNSATAYHVYVRANCDLNGYSSYFGPVSFTTPEPPPANDNCSTATLISGCTSVQGNTAFATGDGLTSFCGTSVSATSQGVWYRFVGDGNPVEVNTCGSNFDTKIQVLTGPCNSLTCIGGNDDSCSSQSRVNFSSNFGQTYYIYVYPYSNPGGPFTLNLISGPPCQAPQPVATSVGVTSASVSWPAVSGAVSYDYSIGTSSFCSNGTVTNTTGTSVNFGNLIPNTTYFVCVRTNCTCGTSSYTSYSFTTLPLPNDLCAGAAVVSCGSTVSGSTVGATSDAGSPTCVTSGGGNGVWYKFVGNGAQVTLDLCSSSYDTKVLVYSGSCGALTCVTGNDDFCGSRSRVVFVANAGTDYYILVSGFGSSTGSFNMEISCTCGPDLGAPWTVTSIGGAVGTAIDNVCESTIDISSNGTGTPVADKLRFAWVPVCGDVVITARIANLTNGAFGGIMFRESDSPGSRRLSIRSQLGASVFRDIRQTTNGFLNTQPIFRPQSPRWMRIERTGNIFRGLTSVDGQTWTQLFAVNLNFPSCMQVGLLTQGVNVNQVGQVNFGDVDITGSTPALSAIEGGLNATGVEQANLSVYPNPTADMLNVKVEDYAGLPAVLTVRNTLGQVVQTLRFDEISELLISIPVGQLPAGVYNLTLQAEGREPQTRAFVVNRARP